jgi:hypothetical protein
MLWVRQALILVASALVLVNAQCVARCASLPCHDSAGVPPCHKHHGSPKQSDKSNPCGSLKLVADGPVSAVEHLGVEMVALVPPVPIAAPLFRSRVIESASPPLSSESAFFFSVLRI